MKFKIENSVIILISIIGMDIIMYLWIVNLFFKMDVTIVAGIIAFAGAVIGGYLTWSGVRYNIEHQKAKDRLERLPDILKKCWQINTKYIAFGSVLAYSLSTKKDMSKEQVELKIEEFYKQTEEIATELALDVSPEMYRLVLRYYTVLTDYGAYVAKKKQDDFIKELYELDTKAIKMVNSLSNEYEKLADSLKVEV
ncbi:hypothetical protein [Lysinibacillus irui]|uniref:hypothetical protein n=1 Tax=Lysinibacillus irui TaxID=2998077 RepID=UPI002AD5A565|nr:hypothetical protein [Lysinibacillus irui]MEA0563286.1 hypothetical protein [Lysinibacillus irui]